MASASLKSSIERELGSGGMATVHLAHDKKHDRKVAIKILHAKLSIATLAPGAAAPYIGQVAAQASPQIAFAKPPLAGSHHDGSSSAFQRRSTFSSAVSFRNWFSCRLGIRSVLASAAVIPFRGFSTQTVRLECAGGRRHPHRVGNGDIPAGQNRNSPTP